MNQSWPFKKNKNRKPHSQFNQNRNEKTRIYAIWNENYDIKTDTTKIKNIISNSFANLHANKLENSEEMHRILDPHELAKLDQKYSKTWIIQL